MSGTNREHTTVFIFGDLGNTVTQKTEAAMFCLEAALPSDWSALCSEATAIPRRRETCMAGSRFPVLLVGKSVRLTHRAHPHLAVDEAASGGQRLPIDLQKVEVFDLVLQDSHRGRGRK